MVSKVSVHWRLTPWLLGPWQGETSQGNGMMEESLSSLGGQKAEIVSPSEVLPQRPTFSMLTSHPNSPFSYELVNR
jgi:hypothetical protein